MTTMTSTIRAFVLSLLVAGFLVTTENLLAKGSDSTVTIVLKLRMPNIKPVNNINLPGFNVYFENNTDTYSLFEATPNYRVKTKRLRYLLTDPMGQTHIAAPVAKHHDSNDDDSNYTVLDPGEKTRLLRLDIQGTLEQYFWEWWQDPLWKPGKYTLRVAYFPGPFRDDLNHTVVQDTVYSNPVEFTIRPTPQFLPEPDHHHKINKGFIRSLKEDEKFIHIRYANAEGQITGDRIYISRPQTYTEPVFEIVYDQPVQLEDSVHWRLGHHQIHTGHGSQHIPFWVPTVPQESLNGMARTWYYKESYIRKGRPLAEAKYKNGKLDGPMEVYLDGRNIQGHYRDGMRNGTWSVWQGSDLIFSAEFKNDVFHGKYVMRQYQSSKVWKAITYRNGEYHGFYETFYENGRIKKHFEYEDGVLSGLAIWYSENGFVEAKGIYVDGKPYDGTFFSQYRGMVTAGGRPVAPSNKPMKYKMGVLQSR